MYICDSGYITFNGGIITWWLLPQATIDTAGSPQCYYLLETFIWWGAGGMFLPPLVWKNLVTFWSCTFDFSNIPLKLFYAKY